MAEKKISNSEYITNCEFEVQFGAGNRISFSKISNFKLVNLFFFLDFNIKKTSFAASKKIEFN